MWRWAARAGGLALGLCAFLVATGCSRRSAEFESNFARVRIAMGKIVDGKTDAPYSGQLVARDREIAAIAELALAEPPFVGARKFVPAELDMTGLILVAQVDQGVLAGPVLFYVDLASAKNNKSLAGGDDSWPLALARGLLGTAKLGEASFRAGRLDGKAVIYGPSAANPLSTTKIAEAELHAGLLDGAVIEYHRGTEAPKRVVRFARGMRSGLTETFFPSGALESQTMFVDGERHGEHRELYADGTKHARTIFAHDQPTGTAERWFPTGQRQLEIVYDPSGARSNEWYSNGRPKAVRGENGVETVTPPDGEIVEYDASGAVRGREHYVEGVRQGDVEVFYSNGVRRELAHYEHGKQQGPHKKWWTNGQIALDSTWVDGALDGDYRRYYASGKPWESAHYVGGRLDGPYRKWWKNGIVAEESAYKEGALDGPYRTYYDTGAKWLVGEYREGARQRPIERWFKDGKRLTTNVTGPDAKTAQ
jgi:antitoxin component YwqK of YwqJK toxin-antitoxin module